MSSKFYYLNSSFFRFFEKALSSKTIELDHLKAEWTAKMNDLTAKHKHEMATEKEKAIQVKYIVSRVHVEKKIKYIQALKMFELIFSPLISRCRAVISRDKKGREKTWSKLTWRSLSRWSPDCMRWRGSIRYCVGLEWILDQ